MSEIVNITHILKLKAFLEKENTTVLSIDWGPEAKGLTADERAKLILEAMESTRLPSAIEGLTCEEDLEFLTVKDFLREEVTNDNEKT